MDIAKSFTIMVISTKETCLKTGEKVKERRFGFQTVKPGKENGAMANLMEEARRPEQMAQSLNKESTKTMY